MAGRNIDRSSVRGGQMRNSPLEKSSRAAQFTQELVWSNQLQMQYGRMENRNLEGSSQLHPDTIQEPGKKMKELITEIEHLKRSVDPLAVEFIDTLIQQVSTFMKLLSKTNQQPLESEQVRKQNRQREESLLEAKAVPEERGGHKGKYQIPLDASASNGKGSSSEDQGIQPCLQSTVCNVQVLVTGETFGSEQQFLNEVEQHLHGLGTLFQKEDYTSTSDKLLLLFCPITTRFGTDIEPALENISSQRKAILIVMHFTPNQSLSLYVTSNWIQHGSLINTVDCRFSEGSGLYDCKMNTEAVLSVASKIQQQAEQSRENMLLQYRDRNIEERSQKQIDTVQEVGNKTEELISEIEPLKRSVDPLAVELIDTLTQQVRTYVKLLSKTNQQSLECEQVRKQNCQREESLLESKAVPKDQDRHTDKCQSPLDASMSNRKGCKSQGWRMPSSQSRVCNVQVLVTGQTFGSEQQFLIRVEQHLHGLGTELQKEDYTSTSNKLLLLFCPVISRPGPYIDYTWDKISGQRKIILVVMHCTLNPSLSHLNSSQVQRASLISTVDCSFSKNRGLYSCEMNTKAVMSVASKIQDQVEQSREHVHEAIENKSLEGCSQKQTVQEIGNKTEELISETEHLKRSVDPLVLDFINTLIQQVRTFVKLLSKTNQQPLKSEQIRKENHQREESLLEAKAVPKEGDGHKGKFQIPLDASTSNGKGSSSEGQEIQPCSQSTVCNVQVLVTGQTFGSEQQFLIQVEQHLRGLGTELQKEDYTSTSDKLLLLFCPITSRHGTDINYALENIPNHRQVILVVMHYSPNRNLPLYLNSSQVQRASFIHSVNCRFSEGCGLYSCRMNTEAITSVASNILQWQSNLREKR